MPRRKPIPQTEDIFDWQILVYDLGSLGWQNKNECYLKAEVYLTQQIEKLDRGHKIQFIENDSLFDEYLERLVSLSLRKYGQRNITDLT